MANLKDCHLQEGTLRDMLAERVEKSGVLAANYEITIEHKSETKSTATTF